MNRIPQLAIVGPSTPTRKIVGSIDTLVPNINDMSGSCKDGSNDNKANVMPPTMCTGPTNLRSLPSTMSRYTYDAHQPQTASVASGLSVCMGLLCRFV